MNKRVLVSIITPCYNAQKTIAQTIESVLSQSYENWEMIIVDDCSSDGSRGIIENYMVQNYKIKLIANSANKGVAESRNIAIRKAKGKYIAFLDSDDIWMSQKLEKQISMMHEENILLCYSAYEVIDEHGELTGYFSVPTRVSYEDMLKTSSIGTLTMIYDAEVLGKYYLKELGHEDYVLKLEILKKIPYAKGIDKSLAQYRIAKNSLSSNKLKAAQWQWYIYREVERLSLWKSCYFFTNYIYKGFMKYKKISFLF